MHMEFFTAFTPHPPIIVPDIGGPELAKAQKTVTAMKQLARKVVEFRPDVMLLVSPHAPVDKGAVPIFVPEHGKYLGNLYQFGSSFAIGMPLWLDFVEKLLKDRPPYIKFYGYTYLDHASLVPLYYLWDEYVLQNRQMPVMVLIGYDILASGEDYYNLGMFFRDYIEKNFAGLKVLYLASGDLSHRLTPDAPAGYNPRGAEFDALVVKAISDWDKDLYLSIPDDLREDAGECGYLSFASGMGFAGEHASSEVLSYEAPFGVGYMVAYAK
ncbi:hypothetical protein GM182_05985 [bacterium 3DAC]|nr:hypothetical protein GM182_05985 [bacterium 3DAC]